MATRPCLGYRDRHCGRLVRDGNRCRECAQLYEQGRRPVPSARARGYDAAHERERERWKPMVATGLMGCRRCEQVIPPDAPWDLGHPDAECPKPKAPEHAACNRAAAGRSAHAVVGRSAGSDGDACIA